jgi:1,4-alpha-glucan branching enzyme
MSDLGKTFRIHQPHAAAVFVVGPFNNWSTTATPMESLGDGNWELPLLPDVQIDKLCLFVWRSDGNYGHIVRPQLNPAA